MVWIFWGLAIGAAAGGITGALVNMGIPEEDARHYQSQLEAGRPIVAVEATNDQQAVQDVFQRCGAFPGRSQPGMWGPPDQPHYPPAP